MVDSVIAGTGNSRYLRTSISADTTWAEALEMLRAGTFPIDLAGINQAGFTTLGTALNSDTLLKSAIIIALGLTNDATPSDAWEAVLGLINAKADADSVVTAVTYDTETKTLSATINGASTAIATFDFVNAEEAAAAAPVQSVAGKTGPVTLDAGDVAYDETETYSDGTVGNQIQKNTDDILSIYPTDTASGSIASFADGADGVPVKSLMVNIEPVQSGTGDPSPENVRPISGWDAVSAWRTGKNLIGKIILTDGTTGGVTFTNNNDGTINASGTVTNAGYTKALVSRKAIANGVYRLSGASTNIGIRYYLRDSDGVEVSRGADTGAGAVFTVSDNIRTVAFAVVTRSAGATVDNEVLHPMLSLITESDQTFEPYTGETYPIDLPQTVYGGTLDVTSGTLTVNKVMRAVTSMNRTNDHNFYIGTSAWEHRPLQFLYSTDGIICDRLPTIQPPSSSSAAVDGCYTDSARAFLVRTSSAYASSYDMLAALGGHINICYKTDPFVAAQLTPTEVKTLLGLNNIWADAGDVDVTYRADVQLYVNKKTAQTLTAAASMLSNVETGMTATRPYAVNDFLSVNGQLYRVTASIANGATITPGTNVTETTIGAEITNILNT